MADRQFELPKLAEIYDPQCVGRVDFPLFYLPLVMAATSVLDVGTGTGELLRLARQRGHTGRLVGVDPAEAMLEVGRRERPDIEWLQGTAETLAFDQEFDFVVMTGNAFMVLLDDVQIANALTRVHDALVHNGRFAFDTRNPAGREWERWKFRQFEHDGTTAKVDERSVSLEDELLKFSLVFSSPDWEAPEVSQTTLRLLSVDRLNQFLTDAGLLVAEQFGDFEREPLKNSSLEIVTIAQRP